MSPRKTSDALDKVITLRVSASFFNQLEEKRKKTNCQNVSEMVRAILYKEKIMFYYTDATLNSTALELAGIRKELNQIGININQVTRFFHETDSVNQKAFHALKIAEDYKRVEAKVEQLLIMISEIGKRWLQK
ncbi:hypothetical protein [Chryseolinea sp. H1M3-3]|uniref:hypothetical protein n=1 Tax=Chryseolinea sp. H1M3-3 TaxID=3034144 RepID=UPI0023EDC5B0|nr:hypothetical protein [Chryseolinea sp. H1M3-3]